MTPFHQKLIQIIQYILAHKEVSGKDAKELAIVICKLIREEMPKKYTDDDIKEGSKKDLIIGASMNYVNGWNNCHKELIQKLGLEE